MPAGGGRVKNETETTKLAAHRNPESYVAGASPLTRDGPRFSHDIDLFHDREAAMHQAIQDDTAALERSGFGIEWTRRFPTICTAIIRAGAEGTLLEWVVDSAFRFFPAIHDELFGYVLHPADIATNKVLAAAGRREPRDIVDLLSIHERYLPLGATVWAAAAKDPGLSPEGIVAEIRRNARYLQADFNRLHAEVPIDASAVARALRSALDAADLFVRAMPGGKEGLLFLQDGQPVQPEPEHLDRYVAHEGRERGHWPSSAEIARAMLGRYPPPEM